MNILKKINNNDYYNKLLVSLYFVSIAKLIAFSKEIVLALKYGTNLYLESYLFLFNVFNQFGGIFLYAITFCIVPILSNSRKKDLGNLKNITLTFLFRFGLYISIFLFLFFYFGLTNNVFYLSEEIKNLCLKNYAYFSLIFPFWILTFVLTAFLISKDNQVGSIYEAIPSLTTLMFVIYFFNDIEPLIFGLLVGISLQLIVLYIQNKKSLSVKSTFSTKLNIFDFKKSFYTVLFIQFLMSLHYLIDHFLVSSFPDKALAQFSYAHKTLSFFLTFGSLVISRALLPLFSKSEKKFDIIDKVKTCLVFFTLFCVPLYFNSDFIIKILFERGEFLNSDTQVVSSVFKIFILIIPFFMSYIFLVTYLFSKQNYKKIIEFCLIFILLKSLVVFSLFYQMSLEAIAISNLVPSIIGFIYLYISIKKYERDNLNPFKTKKNN